MKTKLTILILVLLSLFYCNFVSAAYLEGSGDYRTEDEGAIREYAPPKRIMPPKPRDDYFYEFVNSLRVIDDEPMDYKGLELYFLKSDYDERDYVSDRIITLDEAYSNGDIRINEYNSTVSKLAVSNFSDNYIFIMAGEIVVGGKQTRTIATDVLVPPLARNLIVEVYCIEEGRWSGDEKGFAPAEPLLDANIRKRTLKQEGQGSVWGAVKRHEEKTREYSHTHNLVESYSRTQNDRKLERKIVSMRDELPHNAIGMVVVKNERIVGIEVFFSHDMFGSEFNKLFRSYYYMDVASSYFSYVSYGDVKRFLKDLLGARLVEDRSYNGAGVLYNASYSGFYGSVLGFNRVLHLSMID